MQHSRSAVRTRPRRTSWQAYAAAACALFFAVPSFYWAAGGRVGRETIGSEAMELSWGDDPLVMAAVLATGLLKVAAGVFALALVRPWGETLPRWALLAAGWTGTILLVSYGGVQLGFQVAVASGVITPPTELDRYALYWHLYLWSPWFIAWGILLGLAVHRYQSGPSLEL